jgi:hypothetical protein
MLLEFPDMHSQLSRPVAACLVGLLLAGCGTTKSQRATEQLLMSDAVDRSVASIDFRPLSGKRVFLDTKYLQNLKSSDFVNTEYVTSSLRQQMLSAACLLEESADQAEYIAEVRLGALATDRHDVVYGIPASNGLSNAASLVPNAPMIPAIPEIAVAKRNDEMGAAKIAVFAYHRETRQPVWQSGIAQARSSAKDTWLLGAGPFQSGTIHRQPKFAGEKLDIPLLQTAGDVTGPDPLTMYNREVHFVQPPRETPKRLPAEGQQTNFEDPSDPPDPPPSQEEG